MRALNARPLSGRHPFLFRCLLSSSTNANGPPNGTGSEVTNDDAASKRAPEERKYLHIGPAGECWVGSSIFAAKHLQPDYVKSIPLPAQSSETTPTTFLEKLVEEIEGDPGLGQEIYDSETIPKPLLERISSSKTEDGDNDE